MHLPHRLDPNSKCYLTSSFGNDFCLSFGFTFKLFTYSLISNCMWIIFYMTNIWLPLFLSETKRNKKTKINNRKMAQTKCRLWNEEQWTSVCLHSEKCNSIKLDYNCALNYYYYYHWLNWHLKQLTLDRRHQSQVENVLIFFIEWSNSSDLIIHTWRMKSTKRSRSSIQF